MTTSSTLPINKSATPQTPKQKQASGAAVAKALSPSEMTSKGIISKYLPECFDYLREKLKGISAVDYFRDCNHALGDQGLHPASLKFEVSLDAMKAAEITVNLSLERLMAMKSGELLHQHMQEAKKGKKIKELTLRDRELAEYFLFGFPYQSKRFEKKPENYLDYFSSTEFEELRSRIVPHRWGQGVWGTLQAEVQAPNYVWPRYRPIYGALNVQNHTLGAAPSYGSCCVVLKDELKLRSTFTVGDSFDLVPSLKRYHEQSLQAPLVTHDRLDLLLAQSVELKRFMLGQPIDFHYIEAQIFSPICFAKQVKEVRFSKQALLSAQVTAKMLQDCQKRLDPKQACDWYVVDEETLKKEHFEDYFKS